MESTVELWIRDSGAIRVYIRTAERQNTIVFDYSFDNPAFQAIDQMATVDAYHDPAVPAKMYTDLKQYSHRRSNKGPYADNLDIDVLVIGAGFGKLSLAIAMSTY